VGFDSRIFSPWMAGHPCLTLLARSLSLQGDRRISKRDDPARPLYQGGCDRFWIRPPQSSVGGTPGWNLSSSARRDSWPPPGLDCSVRQQKMLFPPGPGPQSPSRWPWSLSMWCTLTLRLVLRVWVRLTSHSHIVQWKPVLRGEGPRFVGR